MNLVVPSPCETERYNRASYKETLDQSDCWKLFAQLWNYTNTCYQLHLVLGNVSNNKLNKALSLMYDIVGQVMATQDFWLQIYLLLTGPSASSFSIISELNTEFPAIWLVEKFLIWRYINRSNSARSGLYNIFEAWPLSLPPLPSRQVNMANSCEWIFQLFARHHCKSRIFERMENFQNDCGCPWTKKPVKNSYSRQLRIVNEVGIWSPAGQVDWPKSVFLQPKATHFQTMMATVDEVNRDKTKVPD